MGINKKGGFLMLLTVSYRNIFRNKRRSILSIVAIGFSVLFIVILQGFMTGMIDNMKQIIKTYETAQIQVYSKDYEAMKDIPLMTLIVHSKYEVNCNDKQYRILRSLAKSVQAQWFGQFSKCMI